MDAKPKNVDECLKRIPPEAKSKLIELRKIIKKVAPKALEKLSYGMPYYGYKGRLVYFRLATNHIGLYIPPPVLSMFKDEIKKFSTSKATIRFPLNEKLPVTLIKKMIKMRMELNEEN